MSKYFDEYFSKDQNDDKPTGGSNSDLEESSHESSEIVVVGSESEQAGLDDCPEKVIESDENVSEEVDDKSSDEQESTSEDNESSNVQDTSENSSPKNVSYSRRRKAMKGKKKRNALKPIYSM